MDSKLFLSTSRRSDREGSTPAACAPVSEPRDSEAKTAGGGRGAGRVAGPAQNAGLAASDRCHGAWQSVAARLQRAPPEEVFFRGRDRWIRGLGTSDADAIGIQPVHRGVDSSGLGRPACAAVTYSRCPARSALVRR